MLEREAKICIRQFLDPISVVVVFFFEKHIELFFLYQILIFTRAHSCGSSGGKCCFGHGSHSALSIARRSHCKWKRSMC